MLYVLIKTFMILILLAPTEGLASSYSSKTSGWSKWDQECYLSSQNLKQAQSKKLIGFCNHSEVHKMSYRQMPITVLELFKSPRIDIRFHALRRLEAYDCENEIACDRFSDLLDSFHQKESLGRYSKELSHRFGVMNMKLKKKIRSIERSKKAGVCGSPKGRMIWLEKTYQIHCPIDVGNPSNPIKMKTPQKAVARLFFDDLNKSSGQQIFSSSYLAEAQDNSGDCRVPWTTIIECGGAEKSRFKTNCSWKKTGQTSQVVCQDLGKSL